MKRFLILLLVAIAAIAVISFLPKGASIEKLDAISFQNIVDKDGIFLIDTHVPEQIHIRGTDAYIPFDQLDSFTDQLPKNKDTPIAVYCRSGSMSSKAAEALKEMGYSRIYDLEGGMNAWLQQKLPTETHQFGEPGAYLQDMTIYKTSTCGCCGNYVQHAMQNGLNIDVKDLMDIDAIKSQYNIPDQLRSCHTSIVGNYFVEGHVPNDAIQKLLNEKPDIAGIALPGMPSGTPGMPGPKNEEWIIYAVKHDGTYEEFMRI